MKTTLTAIVIGFGLVASAFAQDNSIDVSEHKFAVPTGWKSVEPTSSMRKAVLQIAVAGSDKPLEAIFFHFGGDVETNVARWKGQLTGTTDAKTEELTVEGHKITIFVGTGTHTDPFGGNGPVENSALIGALIPVEGSGPIVIKLVGPKDQVLPLLPALKALASSPFKK
jgi:hypothetical protein